MAASLTWNGIPLLVPDPYGQLSQWLRQFQTIEDVIQFCGIESAAVSSINAPQSIAGTGITAPNYPPLPPLALNELLMPRGATRFGHFVGIVPANVEGVGGPGSAGTLALSDGTNTLNVALNILAFRPLTAIAGGNQLALIVLVDQRYAWQFLDCGNILTESGFPMLETSGDYNGTPNNDYGQNAISYSDVVDALEAKMSVTFNRASLEGFISADVLELTNRKYFNAAMMLDAVAESCGLRVWVSWTGAVYLYDSTIGAGSNFDDLTNLVAGGLCTQPENKPATFQVNYPRASYYHSYGDGDRYTVTQPIEGGSGGFLTVNSSCYAHWTSTPDNTTNPPENLATLDDLSSNIKRGVMQWWGNSYDATWLGVKTWTQSGFDNYVAIRYAAQVPNDVYDVPVVSDDIPKEQTKFDLNYYVFTTRAQGMPNNFGSRINLSQDPDITFLRGWQWGKLAEDSTPPTENEAGDKFPQRCKVTIWQLDSSLKEHDTGIEIEAYDACNCTAVIPQGTRVMLFWHEVNRCWKFTVCLDDDVRIVEISPDAEFPDATLVDSNADCVWAARLVDVGTDSSFCSDGNFSLADDVWVAPFNTNTRDISQLPAYERYFAKLVGTYGVGNEDPKPMYVIKEDEKNNVEVVRITGENNSSVQSNESCVWSGFTVRVTPTASLCSDNAYPNDSIIWIATLENTNAITIKTLKGNQKYLGRYVGTFTYGGDRRPLYVIRPPSSENVRIVQIDSTSSSRMIQKNEVCMWPAKTVKTNETGFCGPGAWEQQDSCWLVTMNNDGEIIWTLFNNERYVGVLIGTYRDAPGENALPLYAIKEAHHLIRFELVTPLVCGVTPPPNNAKQLAWNDFSNGYVQVGSGLISVVDPYRFGGDTPYGVFFGFPKTSLQPGYRGYAEWKPDRQIYEIVYMEHPAMFIRFRVRTAIRPDTNESTVTILDYWQGRNPAQAADALIVVVQIQDDANKGLFNGPVNAVGIAVLDDLREQYRIIYLQNWPQFVIGQLTSDISEGAATGSVTYSWGPETSVPLVGDVNLLDKTSPAIFSGTTDMQYHATYDIVSNKYILTWVQCLQTP